ncbi:hypothetical protein PRN20_19995 [Devosia sp. ZB163]|uniref:hypothetical protein n=1 Tax=Devosia sp. ZB163 TaxID=3025938 RepID=UPI00235DF008|nr:hypothetical protein [Devosia sp. ZB163]MDC9826025.1 hypothetical protein [Devosia sp. ZB163]
MTRELETSRAMYEQVRTELLFGFPILEATVPAPRATTLRRQRTFRYLERSLQQAIVVKLARLVTGVQATWHLLVGGFSQEAGAIQRILDQLDSDISFLSGPLIGGKREPIHDRYLKEFFQEEFDGADPVVSRLARDRVPRAKIRAYNVRTFSDPDDNTQRILDVLAFVEGAYSGFIHSAGAHAMDTFDATSGRFLIQGMHGTPFLDDSFVDFRNYLHRSLVAMATAAIALRQRKLFEHLKERSDRIAADFRMHG